MLGAILLTYCLTYGSFEHILGYLNIRKHAMTTILTNGKTVEIFNTEAHTKVVIEFDTMERYKGFHCIEVFHENKRGGYDQESRMCVTPDTADVIYESLTERTGLSAARINPQHVSYDVFVALMKTLEG